MSFILDALKKSEEERKKLQQEQGSPYSPYFGGNVPMRKSRMVPALIITSVLLLITIILGAGWWYVDQQSTGNDVNIADVPPVTPVQETVSVETETTADREDPAVETETTARNEQKVPAQITPATAEKAPAPAPAASDGENIPLHSELPFSTRAMLPDMEFRGHVYSPIPGKRMIMADAAIVREGDLIAPELILQEITENGLIMKFQGTVFKIELF